MTTMRIPVKKAGAPLKPGKCVAVEAGTYIPLCFRCDHRASFLETGHGPRYQCGEVQKSVVMCYTYMPVRPVVNTADMHDKDHPGPFAPAIMRTRWSATRVAEEGEEIDSSLHMLSPDSWVVYWRPRKAGRPKRD